jgi:hypothetical protein
MFDRRLSDQAAVRDQILRGYARAEDAGSVRFDVYRCSSGDHWHLYTKHRIV